MVVGHQSQVVSERGAGNLAISQGDAMPSGFHVGPQDSGALSSFRVKGQNGHASQERFHRGGELWRLPMGRSVAEFHGGDRADADFGRTDVLDALDHRSITSHSDK